MSGKRRTAEHPDRLLKDAQAAWDAALRKHDDPGFCPEDQPLDPVLLAKALDGFSRSAEAFAKAGQADREALSRLGQAEVMLRMPRATPTDRERVAQAEQVGRAALEQVDSVQDPASALRGMLLVAEAAGALAPGEPEAFEARLRSLTVLLDGAAMLARQHGDAALEARVAAEACRVLAERYETERDENLLDALAQGRRAVELMRGQPAAQGLDLPRLLHDMGNICMKLAGDRRRWLAQGKGCYREALSTVDSGRYPRLHRLLEEHLAMADGLLAQSDLNLPDKEMVARHISGIRMAQARHDEVQANALSWGFLAWAWSSLPTPNVPIGQAHMALADQAFKRHDADNGLDHLHHAVGVLAAGPADDRGWAALAEQARTVYRQALQHHGHEATLDDRLTFAERSFAAAQAACERGSRLIDTAGDRAEARAAFDQAMAAFPCHPDAHFYRAVVGLLDGDFKAALADFDFSLQLKPKSLRAHVNRGVVKLRLGDADGALADLDAALRIDPQNADARRIRAGLHEQRGDNAKAAADLEVALGQITDPAMRAAVTQALHRLRPDGG